MPEKEPILSDQVYLDGASVENMALAHTAGLPLANPPGTVGYDGETSRVVVLRDDGGLFPVEVGLAWEDHEHPPELPPGGSAGQVLAKNSSADQDVAWVDQGASAAPAHSDLEGLDYASSGHTGFAGTDVANTFGDSQIVQGRIDAVHVATGREIRIDPANGAIDSINAALHFNRFATKAVAVGVSGGAKIRGGRLASNVNSTPYAEFGDSANVPQHNVLFDPATQTQPVVTVSPATGSTGGTYSLDKDGNAKFAGRVTFGQSGQPSPANGFGTSWIANGTGTKDGVSYAEGDVLITSVDQNGASNTVKLLTHSGTQGAL